MHNGGNGSGYNYAIVSHRGDENFTVHMHENLYSWADLQILEDKSFVVGFVSVQVLTLFFITRSNVGLN